MSRKVFIFAFLPVFFLVPLHSSYSQRPDTRLVKISALDGEKFVQIEVEANGNIDDVSLNGKMNNSLLEIFIPHASFDAPQALIRTGSEILDRLQVRSSNEGVLISGQPKKGWTSSAVRKDGSHAYVRLYFDDSANAPRISIPATPVVNQNPGASNQPPTAQMDEAEIQKLLEQLGQPPAPGRPTTQKRYVGAPISLDLVDADIKNVIRLIAEISGTNIVVDPQVQGRITMKVENVPWDQVLDMILEANDLGTKRQGNVIRIATKEKLKNEYALDQALMEAQLKLVEKQAELEAKKKDQGPIETAFIPIYYLAGVSAPGATQIERETTAITISGEKISKKETQKPLIVALLEPLLSEKGHMLYDPNKRMVIVSDYRSRIAEIRRVIAQLDRPPEQVKLEVRIVEARSTFVKTLGITWGFSYTNQGSHSFNPSFQINLPVDTAYSTLGLGWSLLKGQSIFQIDLAISAAKELGQINLLASPQVYTMTNQEARISQGLQIPYLEQTEQGTLSVKYKDVLLDLKVVPSVTPDRRILMTVQAEKNDVGSERVLAEAAGLRAVEILKESVNTSLLVSDGTIVVLGGVLREENRKSRRATPGLERIPLFGNLFKSYQERTEKNELLIFICPKIVELPSIAATSSEIKSDGSPRE